MRRYILYITIPSGISSKNQVIATTNNVADAELIAKNMIKVMSLLNEQYKLSDATGKISFTIMDRLKNKKSATNW